MTKAKEDLKLLLGRDPSAKEVQKFLTDMTAPSTTTEPAQNTNNKSEDWKKVD